MSTPSERPGRGEGLALVIDGELPVGPWRLGAGPWPRSGGCGRNSRRTSVRGPRAGVLTELRRLPGKANPTRHRYARSGVAVASDGFRVTSRRRLFAFDPAGEALWETGLLGDEQSRFEAGPLILENDVTVVALDHHFAFVDAAGALLGKIEVDGGALDDSGHSPALTADGRLILTGALREVSVVGFDGLAYSLGEHGLDIAPPAVSPDGSLVVAGFSGGGLVRIDPVDGQVRAETDFRNADQMPSVGTDGSMAAGSSFGMGGLFGPDGNRIASVEAQLFASLDDGWLAMSYGALRRLDAKGKELWAHSLGDGIEVGWHQRMVADVDGYAYCALPGSIACVDPEGNRVFELSLPDRPTAMAPLGDGVMVVVTAERVLRLD
ncbi:MAG: PQQ-binding-like beta-propeller repeat protein [Deltaproteobacteria bacterium]|nr:PQQ-binding-like beta-propeller repeat protein [Deltaproteobacteria bacterium]